MTSGADQIVEGFDVVARVGTDRLGTVCHARERATQRSVAIRFVHAGAPVDDFGARAEALKQRLASLSSQHPFPHISRLELAQIPPSQLAEVPMAASQMPIIVTPFYARGTIQNRVPTTWSALDLLTWFVPVAAALDALHAAGAVHGDLRTDRVLWSRDDRAVLIDAGTATLVSELDIHESDPYLPPENRTRHEPNQVADRYAFATVLAASLGRLGPLGRPHVATLGLARSDLPEERPTSCTNMLTELIQAAPQPPQAQVGDSP